MDGEGVLEGGRAHGFMVVHSFRNCRWQRENASDFLIKEKEECADNLGHAAKGKEANLVY